MRSALAIILITMLISCDGHKFLQDDLCEKCATVPQVMMETGPGDGVIRVRAQWEEGRQPVECVFLALYKDGEFLNEQCTQADGTCSFDGLAPGTYSLRSIPPGQDMIKTEVEVLADQIRFVNIEVGKKGTVIEVNMANPEDSD